MENKFILIYYIDDYCDNGGGLMAEEFDNKEDALERMLELKTRDPEYHTEMRVIEIKKEWKPEGKEVKTNFIAIETN